MASAFVAPSGPQLLDKDGVKKGKGDGEMEEIEATETEKPVATEQDLFAAVSSIIVSYIRSFLEKQPSLNHR
jgi:hypothetical protein